MIRSTINYIGLPGIKTGFSKFNLVFVGLQTGLHRFNIEFGKFKIGSGKSKTGSDGS
jgi:hypothetical protein